MKTSFYCNHLIEQFRFCRGKIEPNVELSKSTWFKVGGPAEVMFWPADLNDLMNFLQKKPDTVSITMIGIGSNVLVRDGGIPGVTIRLGKVLEKISVNGREIFAGGGLSNLKLANVACENGVAGFEFLSGIPGTVGGSIRMNAGAYGSEIRDILHSVQALDIEGNLVELSTAELQFGYRHSQADNNLIYVGGRFKGILGDIAQISGRMDNIRKEREVTQPVKMSTGGSTFVNPPGLKAWELIDAAGCRGLIRGGAVVSEKHCNFLINTGSANAADLEGLGEEIRDRVFEACGIRLDWEIHRIGVEASALSERLSG